MKHVDVEALVSAIPMPPRLMARKEKLTHWAELVRNYHGELALYHSVEYWQPHQLTSFIPTQMGPASAMTIAANDPTFQSQGLSVDSTMAEIMRFFELSQRELHEFSCDCGGYISNRQQADRIANL